MLPSLRVEIDGRECSECLIFKNWDNFPTVVRFGISVYRDKCYECSNTQSGGHKMSSKTCEKPLNKDSRVSNETSGINRNGFKVDEDGRQCTACRKYLPWSVFDTQSTGTHGHKSQCRSCMGRKDDGVIKERICSGCEKTIMTSSCEPDDWVLCLDCIKEWNELDRKASKGRLVEQIINSVHEHWYPKRVSPLWRDRR